MAAVAGALPQGSDRAHPLRHRRRRRNVLRHLPARQRARRGAPGARARRGAAARLHADAHRRRERLRRPRLLLRDQRLPRAARAAAPEDPRRPRLHLGRAGRDPARDRPRPLGRPRAPRRHDHLDAAGEVGHQAKEFAQAARLPEAAAAVRRRDAAHVAARVARAAARRELGRPVVCTLSGEDLFLEGAAGALQEGGEGADRAATPRRSTRFVATSDYYADFMAGYLELPRKQIATVPIGIKLRRASSRPAPAAAIGLSRSATSPGSLPRRACTCWPRRTSSGRRELGLRRRGWRPPATWPPSTAPTSTGSRRRSRRSASRASSTATRRSTGRAQDRLPAGARRAVRAEPVRGAEGPLPARGARHRRPRRRAPSTGPSPSSSSGRAAGCCSRPATCAAWRTAWLELQRDPARARSSACAGSEGARATTPPRAWASARSRSAPRGRSEALSVQRLMPEAPSRRRFEGVRDAARTAADPARGRSLHARGRRVAVHRRALGQRQEHAALHPRHARAAEHGRVQVDGRDVHALAGAELAAFRNREVGFVFQDHFLLPQLSVLENVLAPTLVARGGGGLRRAGARAARARGPRRPARAPARGAVGRRAPAHGARARARDAAARRCCATSRPATSTPSRRGRWPT